MNIPLSAHVRSSKYKFLVITVSLLNRINTNFPITFATIFAFFLLISELEQKYRLQIYKNDANFNMKFNDWKSRVINHLQQIYSDSPQINRFILHSSNFRTVPMFSLLYKVKGICV